MEENGFKKRRRRKVTKAPAKARRAMWRSPTPPVLELSASRSPVVEPSLTSPSQDSIHPDLECLQTFHTQEVQKERLSDDEELAEAAKLPLDEDLKGNFAKPEEVEEGKFSEPEEVEEGNLVREAAARASQVDKQIAERLACWKELLVKRDKREGESEVAREFTHLHPDVWMCKLCVGKKGRVTHNRWQRKIHHLLTEKHKKALRESLLA